MNIFIKIIRDRELLLKENFLILIENLIFNSFQSFF
jgi:hypothetical protein